MHTANKYNMYEYTFLTTIAVCLYTCTYQHVRDCTEAWLCFRQAAFTPCLCDFILFIFVLFCVAICYLMFTYFKWFHIVADNLQFLLQLENFPAMQTLRLALTYMVTASPLIYSYLVYGVLQGLTVITNHSQLFTEFGNFAEK